MTQLTYNEAFDPFHAAFRFFRLNRACDFSTAIPFDTLRILDFYLLFPFRLQNMSFVSEDRAWRKISRNYCDYAPYGELPDDNSIFSRMESFQRAAISSLVHFGALSDEAWNNNEVLYVGAEIPRSLLERCDELNTKMSDIVDILCQIRKKYPLLGRGGLKDRTGLLEYRYDSV
ncbi:ABC-three component system middle component 5 [Kordiimonas sp.]|uniref:ABC-three component system middle component 5 n=1 Tax=Kordiimonas sp. TaxID=1970157 RepID=UPI003A916A9E